MNLYMLQTTLETWLNWSKQQPSDLTRSIEHLQNTLDQPMQLYWTGNRKQASRQLKELLQFSIINEVCEQAIPLPLTIRYGAENTVALVNAKDEARTINVQQLATIQASQWKEVQLSIANPVLKNYEVLFVPFDCENLHLEFENYIGIVVSTNNEMQIEQDFVSQIPKHFADKLHIIQSINEQLVLSQIQSMFTLTPEASKAKQLLRNFVHITEQMVKMTKSATNQQAISQFQTQYSLADQQVKLVESLQAIDNLISAVYKVDGKKIATYEDMNNYLQYLQPLCEALSKQQMIERLNETIAYMNQEYQPALQQYEKAIENFNSALNRRAIEEHALVEEWRKINNPYYFFGKVIRFKEKVNRHNTEMSHVVREERDEVFNSIVELTSQATVAEKKVNELCQQLLNAAHYQRLELINNFKQYEQQYEMELNGLYAGKQQSLKVLIDNYAFMNSVFQQIVISYDDDSKRIGHHLHEIKSNLDEVPQQAVYTPFIIPSEELPRQANGVTVIPNTINKSQLEQFSPRKLNDDFRNFEDKIYFRRYKINAGIFLLLVFIGGMYSTSSYASVSWIDEENESYESTYEEDTESSYNGQEEQYDTNYENDEEPEEIDTSVGEEPTYEESTYEEQTYEQPTEDGSEDIAGEMYEESEYVWPSEDEMDHMAMLAYQPLTVNEAINVPTTEDTEYLYIDTLVYTEYGDLFGVVSDDFDSRKYLLDTYSFVMKDVLNGMEVSNLEQFIAPNSPVLEAEREMFENLAVMEEGMYHLVGFNIDPEDNQNPNSVGLIQIFEYTAPSGEVSYFETRATFDFIFDGEFLYIYDIIRHYK